MRQTLTIFLIACMVSCKEKPSIDYTTTLDSLTEVNAADTHLYPNSGDAGDIDYKPCIYTTDSNVLSIYDLGVQDDDFTADTAKLSLFKRLKLAKVAYEAIPGESCKCNQLPTVIEAIKPLQFIPSINTDTTKIIEIKSKSINGYQ